MALKCIRQLRAMNTVHEYPALRTRGEEHVRAHVFFWTRCPSARARARGTGWPSSIVGPSSWAPSSGKDTLYPASCVILYIYREKRYIERSTFFIYFIDRACTCAPVLLLRTLRIPLSLSFSFSLFLAARFLLLRLA